MRRWLLVLAAVALVLGLGLGLAAYNLDAYLEANRDTFGRQAAAALGREVRFGEVGVSLGDGLALRVAELEIADDPAFSSDPFLVAEALEVRVAILPALRGRIEVKNLLLRSPSITLVRTAQGLSTASLGRHAGGPPAAPEPSPPAESGPLAVALVDIEDGTLRYVDRTARPPLDVALRDLDFHASERSADAPIAFEMEAALLEPGRQDLRASGEVRIADEPTVDVELALDARDLAEALERGPLARWAPARLAISGSARLELRAKGSAADLSTDASFDGSDAELRLGDAFEKPRGRPLSLAFSARRRGERVEIGAGELVVDTLPLAFRGSVDGAADPQLRLEGSSAAGSLRGLEYRDLAIDLRAGAGKVEVTKLSLGAHEGRLDASGSANLRAPGGAAFEARLRADGMSLESLLAAHAPTSAGRASGRVAANLVLRGEGARTESLAGGGELHVADGVLRGFNPARDALRALVGLPLLVGGKLDRLLEAHPELARAEDTPFERIDAQLEVAGAQAVLRDGRLVAPDYRVTGRGRYAFAGRLDSHAVLAFSKALSDEIVDAEKRLRLLRSPEGRVELPVLITGSPGDFSVQPDLVYVASLVSREALTGVVGRVLEAPRDVGVPVPPPPASIEEAGRDLLRGLGGLIGGRPREEDEEKEKPEE